MLEQRLAELQVADLYGPHAFHVLQRQLELELGTPTPTVNPLPPIEEEQTIELEDGDEEDVSEYLSFVFHVVTAVLCRVQSVVCHRQDAAAASPEQEAQDSRGPTCNSRVGALSLSSLSDCSVWTPRLHRCQSQTRNTLLART